MYVFFSGKKRIFKSEKDSRSHEWFERKTVQGALQIMKGDLFVALSGCTAGIIGDNTVEIAKEFAENGSPVVGAEISSSSKSCLKKSG